MFASNQVLLAFPESAGFPSFGERESGRPPTVTLVDAFTTVTPAVDEFRFTEHEPVPPEVVQDELSRLPGPLNFESLIPLQSDALTCPPVPVFTFTCPVNWCGELTSFVA